MLVRLLVFILFTFFSASLWAQSASFGTYVPYAFSSQSDMEGSSTKFDLNPYVSVSYAIPLWGRRHFALPELGFVHHTDRADETSVRTIFILYNFGYHFTRQFMLRYGFGTFATRISGDDEEVVLMDGASERVFYSPNESRTTYVATVNLGGEYRFNRSWAAKLDGHIMTPLSSETRKFSYTLSAAYYW